LPYAFFIPKPETRTYAAIDLAHSYNVCDNVMAISHERIHYDARIRGRIKNNFQLSR
jgi:hypothetical protein